MNKEYTLKLKLRADQEWAGKKEKGEKQKQLKLVAERIISGEIKIEPQPIVAVRYLNVRYDYQTIKQLNKIAEEHEISTQELLRLGLERFNLLT